MIGILNSSFFEQIGRKLFNWRLNREIFQHLCPHLQHESDKGYPFKNAKEMITQTEALDVRRMVSDVEKQIERLPAAYGQCFRYMMRNDIHKRLQMYAAVAKRRTPPAQIAPRFIARRA